MGMGDDEDVEGVGGTNKKRRTKKEKQRPAFHVGALEKREKEKEGRVANLPFCPLYSL